MAMAFVGYGSHLGGDDFEFTVSGGFASVTFVVATVLQTPSVEQATTNGVSFGGESLSLIQGNEVNYWEETTWNHEMWAGPIYTPTDAKIRVDRSGLYNATYCGASSFRGGGVIVSSAQNSHTAWTGPMSVTLNNADADAIYVSSIFIAQGLGSSGPYGDGHTLAWTQGTGPGAAHGGSWKRGIIEHPSTEMLWGSYGEGRMMIDGICLVDVAEGLDELPGQDLPTGPGGGGGETPPSWNLGYPPYGRFDGGFAYNAFKSSKQLVDRYTNVKIY